MAEIKIQKKRAPVWPWILGLLLIAAVAWVVLSYRNDNTEEAVIMNDTTDTTSEIYPDQQQSEAEAEVNRFVSYVQENDTTRNIDNYVKEGLTHLNGALEAIITEVHISDSNIVAQHDSLQRLTTDIDGKEVKQTNNIRTALIAAANVIEEIQRADHPDLKSRADQLLKTAQSLNGRKSLEEQDEQVKEFFGNAGDILESMITREL